MRSAISPAGLGEVPHLSTRGLWLTRRERQRQPETGEHTVVEPGQSADLLTCEGEHNQAGTVAGTAVRTAQIGAKCRLAVCPRGYEVVHPGLTENTGVEAGNDVAALPFQGDGRHGHLHVVGEHGEQLVDVAGLVRPHEPLHEGLLTARANGGRTRTVSNGRQALLEAGAGALESTVHRTQSQLEHVGHLVGVVPEHVAQDKHGPLAGGAEPVVL